MGITYLLGKKTFLPLFLTQFFGAFNDNAFKFTMLTLVSYRLTHNQIQSEYLQAIASALFIIPFFIFSAISGELADKYDKALLIRFIKVLEVILMIIGSIALYFENLTCMMLTLLGLGIHSTFFGPIKYSILPDHLSKEDLLGATGLIEASTFLAVLLGTILGSLSIGWLNTGLHAAVVMVLTAACAGLVASLFIPSAPSSALGTMTIDLRFWRSTMRALRQLKDFNTFLTILVISWFWLIGAVLLTKLPDYTHYVLNANATILSIFLALFSIGIAIGSLTTNMLFKGRISLSIVPFAMLTMSLFMIDLYCASPLESNAASLMTLDNFFTDLTHWRIAFDLFMLSFCSGLFIVPLYAYLQVVALPEVRGRTIAVNNIYNALFIVVGTLFVMLLVKVQVTIPQVFLVLGVLNGVVALSFWCRLRYQKRTGMCLLSS